MLATVILLCITFGLGIVTQANVTITTEEPWIENGLIIEGNMFTDIPTERPKDCQDVIKKNKKIYEGNYVVYPHASAPNRASMIYCSQDEGFSHLPMSMANREGARNCLELQYYGMDESGVNIIYPYPDEPTDPVLVFCDQETDDGGWTVIQNRYDGSEDFYRGWNDYDEGFGNPNEEHYIGNALISILTGQIANELWVKLEDWENGTADARYQSFFVDPRDDHHYRLQVSLYNGTAGDSIDNHTGQYFSTFDAVNNSNNEKCPENHHGAWWYNNCGFSNLNGRYYPSDNTNGANDGMFWDGFKGELYSLKSAKMMTRPYCASCSFAYSA